MSELAKHKSTKEKAEFISSLSKAILRLRNSDDNDSFVPISIPGSTFMRSSELSRIICTCVYASALDEGNNFVTAITRSGFPRGQKDRGVYWYTDDAGVKKKLRTKTDGFAAPWLARYVNESERGDSQFQKDLKAIVENFPWAFKNGVTAVNIHLKISVLDHGSDARVEQ